MWLGLPGGEVGRRTPAGLFSCTDFENGTPQRSRSTHAYKYKHAHTTLNTHTLPASQYLPQDAIEDEEDAGMNDAGTGAAGPSRARRTAAAAKRGPSAATVSHLVNRRGAYVRALEMILEAPPAPAPEPEDDDDEEAAAVLAAVAKRQADELRELAFCGLADLLLLANGPRLQGIEGVAMAAGPSLMARMWGHLERLLAEEEEEVEGGDQEDDRWEGEWRGL